MKEVNPTHLGPKNSTQQQLPIELEYMPLKSMSPTDVGPVALENTARNIEYAPLDMRTRSWEVGRNDVKVEKIIGKGAFAQVAKGTAENLSFRSGSISVAIKMVKGKVQCFSLYPFVLVQIMLTTNWWTSKQKNGFQTTIYCEFVINFAVMFLSWLPVSISRS